jgi:hypothetical protein
MTTISLGPIARSSIFPVASSRACNPTLSS